MWKKGGGRFAGIPGKRGVATLNGSVVFPRKTKVSRLDFVFSFRFQPSSGVFVLPCVQT